MNRFRKNDKWFFVKDFCKETTGFCSAAALANACVAIEYLYKYTVVNETIAATAMKVPADTVERGADEKAILKGLRKLGFKSRPRRTDTKRFKVLSSKDFAVALRWLTEGYVVIAITRENSHWVVITMDDYDKIILIDADNTYPMLTKLSHIELEREWRINGLFYGIGVK
ncbi:MAG TPA: hypothetical protein VFJ29_06025 [Candidatus Kapabacteria bacterium]|nr:hypothetical protein [Candidatus Kapabacteria bacterium]